MIEYIFCLVFKIIRNRYYIVFEDGTSERIFLTHSPNIIYFSKEHLYYSVQSETSEVINKTLVYNWLKVEKIEK